MRELRNIAFEDRAFTTLLAAGFTVAAIAIGWTLVGPATATVEAPARCVDSPDVAHNPAKREFFC